MKEQTPVVIDRLTGNPIGYKEKQPVGKKLGKFVAKFAATAKAVAEDINESIKRVPYIGR